jgi:glycosyltransferase involved in cell wall biosynthesis
MKTRILYVERQPSLFVSIEKVFRQIAASLSGDRFDTKFQQVPYGNNLLGVLKNLLFFDPESTDIYHITGHVHYLALVLPPKRTALTIHDLRFLNDRTGIRRLVLKKLYFDWPLRRLRYVTAISEATRNEIIKHAPYAAEKVRVIENPLGPQYIANDTKEFNADDPLILQIGTMENKNVPNLIRALEGIKCRLRIIGPLDDKISAELDRTKIDYETDEHVDDGGMLAAYREADIIAFCSTYEGFGLPIIEGQAMRKPVVTSSISPMLEVSGMVAELIDPYDFESIRAGINRIIADKEHRMRMIKLGVENAKRFDATAIAEKYGTLYDEMLAAN